MHASFFPIVDIKFSCRDTLYITIQYKTCKVPYVSRMLFVGAGDDTWLSSIGNVEKMSLKFTFKNINRVASSNVIWQIIPIYSNKVFETTRRWNSLHVADSCLIYVQSKFKVGAKKTFFCLPARGGKCAGEFGPNFSNSNKWICVQVWLRSIQWSPRLGVEKRRKKERRKNHSG